MKILENHPDIIRSKHPGEDFIIHNSGKLYEHMNELKSCWSNSWKGMDKELYYENYFELIRKGILEFLMPLNIKNQQYCITKTPSVVNIEYATKLFPKSKFIILVRDGKNVIESGVVGFNWDYKSAIKKHALYGNYIVRFMKKNKNNPNVILIRYEDILKDGKNELTKLFNQFNLDPNKFDYSQIDSTPVYGSSFLKKENKVTWQPIEKNDDFNPLERSKGWGLFTKLYYNYYCKENDKFLGY